MDHLLYREYIPRSMVRRVHSSGKNHEVSGP